MMEAMRTEKAIGGQGREEKGNFHPELYHNFITHQHNHAHSFGIDCGDVWSTLSNTKK